MSVPDADKPPRRPRYAGKYPRRFEHRYKELEADRHPGIVEHVRAQGRTPAGSHVPIMLAEVMACLHAAAGEVVVDGTVGFGGHAVEFLRRICPGGRLIGFDVDSAQLERARHRLAATAGTFVLHARNFAGIGKVVAAEAPGGADVIFADLGVSSMQLDDPARGFSYKEDGPLDMRMDEGGQETAADVLARMSREELSAALWELADEQDHERIAEAVANRLRTGNPVTRTRELSDLVMEAKGITRKQWKASAGQGGRAPHPAARTFLSLRILVNDELGVLRELLRVAPWCLRSGGRIGILTFHSGEDRLVKHAFQEGLRQGLYRETNDQVLRPSPAELRSNPRSSSAKLRWAVRA